MNEVDSPGLIGLAAWLNSFSRYLFRLLLRQLEELLKRGSVVGQLGQDQLVLLLAVVRKGDLGLARGECWRIDLESEVDAVDGQLAAFRGGRLFFRRLVGRSFGFLILAARLGVGTIVTARGTQNQHCT